MDLKNFLVGLFFAASICSTSSSITPVSLKTEYLVDPLTLETQTPRFTWRNIAIDAENNQNLTQSAYQILVSSSPDGAELWDSGIVRSDETTNIKYAGNPLKSRLLATWKVNVWDQDGVQAESVKTGTFGIGLLEQNEWTAKWINAPASLEEDAINTFDQVDQELMEQLPGLRPVLHFRKSFNLQDTTGTRLFSTAKGIYEMYINGVRLQFSHFNPGWTDYEKSFRYQSFENIENLLRVGENVIAVTLTTGWYSGYVGFNFDFNLYGSDIGALVQLDQNDVTIVASDSTWKISAGPMACSDFLAGETYYVDREMIGWNDVNFDDSQWAQAVVQERRPEIAFVGDVSEPIATTLILNPLSAYEESPGVWIVDFGQNFAGYCSFAIHAGQEPARIQLRHAEVLQQLITGPLYTDNLRRARATDTIVIKETVTQAFDYHPSFTYHGFRYVEVTGLGQALDLADITGHVLHSGFPMMSHMTTSNEFVNRLLLNIQWGLRSNFMSVPTDCPQRDERLGWTGDAQTFAPTAVYNADLAAFYTKWMVDMREGQGENGGFSNVAPRKVDPADGAPGWGDAGVIVPWVVYNTYGDEQIILDNYVAMKKWIDYIKSENPNFIWENRLNNNFGDWLEINAATDKVLLATAYYARDAQLLSRMAAVIGETEDAQMYSELFQNISLAFNSNFVEVDGTIKGDTQAAYVFALAFTLLPENMRPLAVQKLVDNINVHDMHLTTGFYGVGFLNPVLTEFGHNEIAYQLLLQDSFPSWLYPVQHANATTIWERWDGWTEDRGFQDPGMNSFNHYSLGSVGSWMYEHVAGIATDGPGFKNIIIKPNPAQGLTYVSAHYESIHGPISSDWTVNQDTVDYVISIPVNTRATIHLPGNTDPIQVGSGTWMFNTKKMF